MKAETSGHQLGQAIEVREKLYALLLVGVGPGNYSPGPFSGAGIHGGRAERLVGYRGNPPGPTSTLASNCSPNHSTARPSMT
jgi:hypothetical protein